MLSWTSQWGEPGVCIWSQHTTGHAGCNLWKGAFSFLQEAGKKTKKQSNYRWEEDFADWFQNRSEKGQSNRETAPLEDDKLKFIMLS